MAARTRQWTYNERGQMLSEKNALSHTSSFAYYSQSTADYSLGDLQSATNALGKVTTFTKYNVLGQLLQSTDPNAVVSTYSYDARQRPVSASVGGQTSTFSYDAVGQLTRITQPDGSWTGYEYDAAHRQTAVLDNVGNRIEYTLDNTGQRIAEVVKDAACVLSRQLSRSIDALGRVQQITGGR